MRWGFVMEAVLRIDCLFVLRWWKFNWREKHKSPSIPRILELKLNYCISGFFRSILQWCTLKFNVFLFQCQTMKSYVDLLWKHFYIFCGWLSVCWPRNHLFMFVCDVIRGIIFFHFTLKCKKWLIWRT